MSSLSSSSSTTSDVPATGEKHAYRPERGGVGSGGGKTKKTRMKEMKRDDVRAAASAAEAEAAEAPGAGATINVKKHDGDDDDTSNDNDNITDDFKGDTALTTTTTTRRPMPTKGGAKAKAQAGAGAGDDDDEQSVNHDDNTIITEATTSLIAPSSSATSATSAPASVPLKKALQTSALKDDDTVKIVGASRAEGKVTSGEADHDDDANNNDLVHSSVSDEAPVDDTKGVETEVRRGAMTMAMMATTDHRQGHEATMTTTKDVAERTAKGKKGVMNMSDMGKLPVESPRSANRPALARIAAAEADADADDSTTTIASKTTEHDVSCLRIDQVPEPEAPAESVSKVSGPGTKRQDDLAASPLLQSSAQDLETSTTASRPAFTPTTATARRGTQAVPKEGFVGAGPPGGRRSAAEESGKPPRRLQQLSAQEATATTSAEATSLVESPASSSSSSSSRVPTGSTPEASTSPSASSPPPGQSAVDRQDELQSPPTLPLRRRRSSRSDAPLRRLIDLLRLLRHRSMDLLRSLAGRDTNFELVRLFIKLFAITWFGLRVLEGLRVGREIWRVGGRAIAAAGRGGRATRVATTLRSGIIDGGRRLTTTSIRTSATFASARSIDHRSARSRLARALLAATRIILLGHTQKQSSSPSALSTALFVAGFPTIWRLLSTRGQRDGNTSDLPVLTALLAVWAPRALSSSVMTQTNLYAISAALLAGARWCIPPQPSTSASEPLRSRHLPYWLQSREQRRASGYATPLHRVSSSLDVQEQNPIIERDAADEVADRHWAWLDDRQVSHSSSLVASLQGASIRIASLARRSTRGLLWVLSSGGGWWIFPLTQGWLLYCCVFEPDCFPASYRRIIVARSNRYLPSAQSLGLDDLPSPDKLITLLPIFTSDPMPFSLMPLTRPHVSSASTWLTQYAPFHSIVSLASSQHARTLCATLHPLEPSCWRNWLCSILESLPSAAALVGTWTGLIGALKWRRGRQGASDVFFQWLSTTARGASFISLAICSAWGYVCLFQRLFHPTAFRRGRFALGGALAGLWIFLVPAARRLELGMYAFRLSLLAAWKLTVKRGWVTSRRSLSAIPTALSLAFLVKLHRKLSCTTSASAAASSGDPRRQNADRKRILHGLLGSMVVGWLERDRDRNLAALAAMAASVEGPNTR